MPLYTEHLNLVKPNEDEFYNVAVPNANMDMIDERIQALEEENRALRAELEGKANIMIPISYELEATNANCKFRETATNTYYKNQEGTVFISFAVDIMDENVGDLSNVQIAQLPEGYRPGKIVLSSGTGHSLKVVQRGGCTISVSITGILGIQSYPNHFTTVFANFSFQAAR